MTIADRSSRYRDPAIEAAKQSVGTALTPSLVWVKTKSDDGLSHSVLLRPQEDAIPLEDRLRAAFDGMIPAAPVIAPENVMDDLCSVYPLMDVHLGMYAWGQETGGPDYDIRLATSDMRMAFSKVLAITPPSKQAVLIIGGDFFHANDNSSETPKSRHKLDVDARHDKVLEAGIVIIADVIEWLLSKHSDVLVRVLRGNHDEESHRVLKFALAERYREDDRVSIEKSPRDLFMFQWGQSAIFAHHGDKAKPQMSALHISDVCPFWSATKHRHMFTGHVHNDQSKDLGPLRWESLRAFCPPDAYAASMGYNGRRALQSITFHNRDGAILRAMDPIERDA